MQIQMASPSTALTTLDPTRIPFPSQLVALLGRSKELHPLILQSLLARAARGRRVGVVVGDNRFHALTLAHLARAHRLDPDVILARVDLSRPFTCYQLYQRVLTIDPQPNYTWSALYILGLLDTFYDEDVPYAEVARLLRDLMQHLKALAGSGLPVLVTLSPPPEDSKRHGLMGHVRDASDAYWQPAEPLLELAARQLSLI